VIVFNIFVHFKLFWDCDLTAFNTFEILELIDFQILEVELSPIFIDFAQNVITIVVVLMRKVFFYFIKGNSFRFEEKLLRQF
jgi:hypothetical protein